MALIMVAPKPKAPVPLKKKPLVEVVAPPISGTGTLPLHKVLVEPEAPTELEALTAEYIGLYRKFLSVDGKNLVKRMEEIRKQLVTVANLTAEDTKPVIFTSLEGEMEFSERQDISEVPDPLQLIADLLEKFGPEAAADVVDIALTPLRKLLSEFELQKYLKKEPGPRTLKAVRPAGGT